MGFDSVPSDCTVWMGLRAFAAMPHSHSGTDVDSVESTVDRTTYARCSWVALAMVVSARMSSESSMR